MTTKELVNKILILCKLDTFDDFSTYLNSPSYRIVLQFLENVAADLMDDNDWQDFQRDLPLDTIPLIGIDNNGTIVQPSDDYTPSEYDFHIYRLPNDFIRLARKYPIYDREEDTVGRAIVNDAQWNYLSEWGYSYQALYRVLRAKKEFHVQRVDQELNPSTIRLSVISNGWLEKDNLYSSEITSGDQVVQLDAKLLEYGALAYMKAHLGHSDSELYNSKFNKRKMRAEFDDKPVEEYRIGVAGNNQFNDLNYQRTPILIRD